MRVLLVDDEEELVSTIAERLEFRGIEADWAVAEEQAVALAEKKDFDIAVIDIKLRGISGFEVKSMLEKVNPKIKYIFLTGHGSENNFKKGCEEAGSPKYYLVKPVNIKKLVALMKELMEEEQC